MYTIPRSAIEYIKQCHERLDIHYDCLADAAVAFVLAPNEYVRDGDSATSNVTPGYKRLLFCYTGKKVDPEDDKINGGLDEIIIFYGADAAGRPAYDSPSQWKVLKDLNGHDLHLKPETLLQVARPDGGFGGFNILPATVAIARGTTSDLAKINGYDGMMFFAWNEPALYIYRKGVWYSCFFISREEFKRSTVPVGGIIRWMPNAEIPSNYMRCDGTVLDAYQYPELAHVITPDEHQHIKLPIEHESIMRVE